LTDAFIQDGTFSGNLSSEEVFGRITISYKVGKG
jgi:hypothetical protein